MKRDLKTNEIEKTTQKSMGHSKSSSMWKKCIVLQANLNKQENS